MLPSGFKRWLLIQAAFLLVAAAAASPHTYAQGDHVAVLSIKGIINPVAAGYVERALNEAESNGATAAIIEMDTPGGLDTSMRAIIQRIIAAKIPVIVYVSPQGARAGSAGVYITYAAQLAAMAPNTNIGSAHPVAMGDNGNEQQLSDTMAEKITNDAVAYIKGLAQTRGRNAEWAEKAVRESVNVTAQEALDLKVIDLVADDMNSLMDQVDGREVQLSSGKVTVRTRGLPLERISMDAMESLLHTVSDPTIAYILLSLGTLGLVFELSNPGAILPGVVGGISLLFALFGLGTLPVNIAGVMLIGFAFLLFVVDIFAPTHGVLTGGGVISFVLGSMMLINTRNAPFLAISTSAIVAVSAALAGFFGFVVGAVVRSHRRRPVTGEAGLIGKVGRVKSSLEPGGMVFVDGELWRAISESGPIAEGELVEVVSTRGLTLVVVPHPTEKQLRS
ncbi:MAG TPA: nodulation protein NfeD [Chloroflexota bacterium]|nr:nodulation protein NfeD [Chloroflexota bacterium]